MPRHFWVSITLALAAYLLLPMPGLSAPLSERIQKKRIEVEHAKRREGGLSQTIASYNTRIERLHGEIRVTRSRLRHVQHRLDRARAELFETRDSLEVARGRLERARRELARGRRVLAGRLVEIYKSDEPDALTVILEADGFADLLDRAEFLERISDQDREIVERVRRLRDRARGRAGELASLENRAELAAGRILRRREEIADAQHHLISSRANLRAARGEKSAALARVRRRHHAAQEDLASLEAEQARVRDALRGASPGRFRHGSGRLIWPVNGPITGLFGEARPGHRHSGIDISAPIGRPIRAADSGRVVLMGVVGGYGNFTCIKHTARMSTCYAHQSRFRTSKGASVHQGQVIGYVGSTGDSTGAHLHFEVRIGGSPVNPMRYL